MTVVQCCWERCGWNEIKDVTWPKTLHWCRRHGYRYLAESLPHTPDRHVAWGKIPALLHGMAIEPRGGYVMWLDTDAVIMNPAVEAASIVTQHPEADLIVTVDGNGINSGVMLLKSGPWARSLFTEAWRKRELIGAKFEEQGALQSILGVRGERQPGRVALVPKRCMNSYPHVPWVSGYPGDFEPGDFVLHAPALSNSDRLRVFLTHEA